MNKHFASTADLEERPTAFRQVGDGCYAFTAAGDPNSGVIVGDRSVMVVDAQATPAAAEKVLEEIRAVTDKPVKFLVLTHYHAVRSLGASAFADAEIISSDLTKRLIADRGETDWAVQNARFPRLFQDGAAIPGLTWPTLSFASSMTIDLGNREVRLMHLGRGHTMGDVVVWVPGSGVMFAGDLVENRAACYCGDAHLADWPRALNRISAFRPNVVVPGRGAALIGPDAVAAGLSETQAFVDILRDSAATAVAAGNGLKDTFVHVKAEMDHRFGGLTLYDHAMPFNVARAYDEALGLETPQAWTPERDRDLWDALYDPAPPASEPETARPGGTPEDTAAYPGETGSGSPLPVLEASAAVDQLSSDRDVPGSDLEPGPALVDAEAGLVEALSDALTPETGAGEDSRSFQSRPN
ncbi:MBL fold metallo-hydrolase [Roseibium aquae]|uniref:MBL fold metallo-hydrolase n=1 Tax=Roseibium aquae TaxID=1323746 RepID=A0A916TG04_9HYPH|nr:MBL fold metallo-hydrolase [Roseibium aquae]